MKPISSAIKAVVAAAMAAAASAASACSGFSRLRNGKVDIGCYQGYLPASGVILSFR